MQQITILGAGLVGAALASNLAQAGYQVDVYDQRIDPRSENLVPGRSINITLAARGFRFLDAMGVGDIVRQHCIPIYGRMIHSPTEAPVVQPYGNNREAIHSIGRHDLQKILVEDAARQENVTLHFQEKCLDIDLDMATLYLENCVTSQQSTVQADRIFGADGAYSVVRRKMLRLKRFNYSQEYHDQAYQEIILPAQKDGSWLLEKNYIHIWPWDNFMLIGFPNLDGSFTLTLHLPFEGEISHASIQNRDDLYEFFKDYFPDILSAVEPYLDSYVRVSPETMITVKCMPWIYKDKVALIGDASHAIFPSYGQGVNSSFEDCAELMGIIEEYGDDWKQIMSVYEAKRKPNADAIADLSKEHFTVLRRLVGDPQFLLRKKIERKLQQMMPNHASLYHNISFTTMPYVEAMQLEHRYSAVVDYLLAIDEVATNLDTPQVEQIILKAVENQLVT